MTWFAWRVQRLEFLVAAGALAAFGIWLAIVGVHEQSRWDYLIQNRCTSPSYTEHVCGPNLLGFTQWNIVYLGIIYAVPGLVGLLLGAPLVAREVHEKTNRVAWTQSISRTQWLGTKVLVAGLITAIVASVLVPLTGWWFTAVHGAVPHLPQPGEFLNRMEPWRFDVSGFVAVGYALFAFALGLALGALVHRTGWAILVGIPLYGLVRFLVRLDVRSHLAPVAVSSFPPFGAPTAVQTGWLLNAGFVPLGRTSPAPGQAWHPWSDVIDRCVAQSETGSTTYVQNQIITQHCLSLHRLHYVVQYQPSSHFWALQTAETAIFIGAAILLLGVAVVAVRRWWT